jgi:hypothetical protein
MLHLGGVPGDLVIGAASRDAGRSSLVLAADVEPPRPSMLVL